PSSGPFSLRLEEDLCCPVCHEVFKYPVILSCTHSFCRDCLQRYWRQKQERECPVCRKISSKSKPPLNRVRCSLHSEKLKLFCLDHQQPVCLVCRDSETHSNHRFRPIDEAAKQCKKELQETLEPVKKKLKSLGNMSPCCPDDDAGWYCFEDNVYTITTNNMSKTLRF
uniref:Tripartite motif containing 35 n=1 Tax=Sander lucioperca TaxID=283035 RepID=A0A8D0DDD9_SANLU